LVPFSWGEILATWKENKEGAKGLEKKWAKLVTL
jgi:hypothetical protein